MHPLSRRWDADTVDAESWVDVHLTVFADPAMAGGPVERVYRVNPDGATEIAPS